MLARVGRRAVAQTDRENDKAPLSPRTGPKRTEFTELSGQLSNPPEPLARMLARQKIPVNRDIRGDGSESARQRQARLSAEKKLELAQRYRAGATQRELAEVYGIAACTVSDIVGRHGVRRRPSRADQS